MALNWDYIDPVELTGYGRAALADQEVNQFALSAWLPSKNIDDLDYRFTKGGEGLIDAATFRAFDAESPIGKRPGFTRVSGELPPISRKLLLGEYDRLKLRQAGEGVIVREIQGDAERVTRSIAARLELARGDALVNGSVTISENGVIASVSYGRAGGHSVSAGTAWSTVATATPLADLLTWKATYRATNGVDPGALLLSDTAFGYLLRNAEIRTLAATVSGAPAIVAQNTLEAVFSAYGLPPIVRYDVQVNVAGVATRVIPADIALFLPAPDPNPETNLLGATLWGVTAESLEPEYGLAGDEAGIVVGNYRDEDPIAYWTKAAAIALPVEANPNLTMKLDVY
jgi:hypothetical protein